MADDDRRREGARAVVWEERPAPGVKVTAHSGDRFADPMVMVWSTDENLAACMAQLDAAGARELARALSYAAAALEAQ
jgi:hypothetical protein